MEEDEEKWVVHDFQKDDDFDPKEIVESEQQIFLQLLDVAKNRGYVKGMMK